MDKKEIVLEKLEEAKESTLRARKKIELHENLIKHCLRKKQIICWNDLKRDDKFSTRKPTQRYTKALKKHRENKPNQSSLKYTDKLRSYQNKIVSLQDSVLKHRQKKPDKNDEKYIPKMGFLEKLLPYFEQKRIKSTEEEFQRDLESWHKKDQELSKRLRACEDSLGKIRKKAKDMFNRDLEEWSEKEREYIEKTKKEEQKLKKWKERKEKFYKTKSEWNKKLDDKDKRFRKKRKKDVELFFKKALLNSTEELPEEFPKKFQIEYNPENSTLVVDYQLPSIEAIPSKKECVYVKSRDEFKNKYITKAQRNQLYDKVLYQLCLLTIYRIFQNDYADVLSSIAINGFVKTVDPSTGKNISPCVLSVHVTKDEFNEISLTKVDPKACFKKLKGIGSSKLHSLAPIAPIIKMNKEDKRFTKSYGVTNTLDEGDNIAIMDWQDFEHLIRELFEKEFSSTGGEVKVTRASRDGGVDAIVFDPDPLRGGKIVIQAKRYTNTVGVAAVRDLYGTVMNEGANKGILVTTSDYGPDAYSFAKDKPLVLLNGSNLLHLLGKHGHKARIDIKEARKLMEGNNESS